MATPRMALHAFNLDESLHQAMRIASLETSDSSSIGGRASMSPKSKNLKSNSSESITIEKPGELRKAIEKHHASKSILAGEVGVCPSSISRWTNEKWETWTKGSPDCLHIEKSNLVKLLIQLKQAPETYVSREDAEKIRKTTIKTAGQPGEPLEVTAGELLPAPPGIEDQVEGATRENADFSTGPSEATTAGQSGEPPEVTAGELLPAPLGIEDQVEGATRENADFSTGPSEATTARAPFGKLMLAAVVGLVVGMLPWASLFLAFEGWEAKMFARVYSHMFYYPMVSGWAVWAGLVMPLSTLVAAARIDPPTRAWVKFITAVWVVGMLMVVSADFLNGNHAVWEVARDAPGRGKLVDLFRIPDEPGRKSFALGVDALIAQGPGYWSVTRWVYPIGLVAQAGPLAAFLPIASLLLFVRLRRVVPHDDPLPALSLATALLGSVWWLLARQLFLHEKAALYPEVRLAMLDVIALLIYAVSFFLLLVMIVLNVHVTRWRCPVCAFAGGTWFIGVFAAGAGLWFVYHDPSTMSRWIGREAEEINFAFLSIFFLFIEGCILPIATMGLTKGSGSDSR